MFYVFSVVLISLAIVVSCIWLFMNSWFSFIWQLMNSLFLGLEFRFWDQPQYSEHSIHRISSSKPQRSTPQNLLLLINYIKDWKTSLMVWCVCCLLHHVSHHLLSTVPVNSKLFETSSSPQVTPGAFLNVQIPIPATKCHIKMHHVRSILNYQIPLPPAGGTWQKMIL